MFAYYTSPIGIIELRANDKALTHLYFTSEEKALNFTNQQPSNNILLAAIEQLQQYFAGARRSFDLPLAPQGTPFQQQVWQALQTINYGETQSYAWLAQKINNIKAVRAVGAANGANPISIIIPCHRVIGKNGTLTGYAGGLPRKEKLLTLESTNLASTYSESNN